MNENEPMPDNFDPTTLDEQIACVRRELAMRGNVYPKWVASQRMTQLSASKEVRHMQAVLATLQSLRGMEPNAPAVRLDPAYCIVPLVPTDAMLAAGNKARLSFTTLSDNARFSTERSTWHAMVAAAPAYEVPA